MILLLEALVGRIPLRKQSHGRWQRVVTPDQDHVDRRADSVKPQPQHHPNPPPFPPGAPIPGPDPFPNPAPFPGPLPMPGPI